MSLQIHNLRLGFACNSSSTHSIVFLPKGKHLEDRPPEDDCFGGECFTLATKDSKLRYLTTAIYEQLLPEVGVEAARILAREWGGAETDDPCIDHQSRFTFPRSRRESSWGKPKHMLHPKFLAEWKQAFFDDRIVVLGGNDNGGEHPERGVGLPWGGNLNDRSDGANTYIARKDPQGYWTLFNPDKGHKMRISLGKGKFKAPLYSTVPELVDLKITNFCPMGCSFCYQDSTTKGGHANDEKLHVILLQLMKHEVFEVAIGGGEPTLYPKLQEVLEWLASVGIKANLTTKNLTWLKAEALDWLKQNLLGAIAFSVQTGGEVLKLRGVLETWPKEYQNRVQAQTILGIPDQEWETEGVLRECVAENKLRFKLMLLGYKEKGRAKKSLITRQFDWIQWAQEHSTDLIGIDTVLVDKYWEELRRARVPESLMTRHEGKFSCYIDAVTNTIGPSSYCDASKMFTFSGDLAVDFKRIREV